MSAGEDLRKVGKLTITGASRRERIRTAVIYMGSARSDMATGVEAAPIGWNHITRSELGGGAELVGKAGNHAGLSQFRRRLGKIDIFVRRPQHALRAPVRITIIDARAPVAVERVFNTAPQRPAGTVTSHQLKRSGIKVAGKLSCIGNLVPRRGEVAEGNTGSTIHQGLRCHEDAHACTNAGVPIRGWKSNPREQRPIAGFVVDVTFNAHHEGVHLIIIPAMKTCEDLSETAVNGVHAVGGGLNGRDLHLARAHSDMTAEIEAGPVADSGCRARNTGELARWAAKAITKASGHPVIRQAGIDIGGCLREPETISRIIPDNAFGAPISVTIFDPGSPCAIQRILDTTAERPANTGAAHKIGIQLCGLDGVVGFEATERDTPGSVEQSLRRHKDTHPPSNARIPIGQRPQFGGSEYALAEPRVDVPFHANHKSIHLIVVTGMNAAECLRKVAFRVDAVAVFSVNHATVRHCAGHKTNLAPNIEAGPVVDGHRLQHRGLGTDR